MMKTPCQLMAETAIKNKTPHYHAATLLKSEDLSFLDNYKGKKGFFIKKFLINDKFNLNRWRVTWEAMKQDIWGFVGKPLVLTPDKDHPPVTYQEDYRVGNIIDVGLDEVSHTAWQVSEVFDEEAQKKILDGEVEFGSPTVLIYSEATREQRFAGTEQQEDILHRFRPAHDALVENPAYGENVDHIPAVCTGDGIGCGLKLLEVSASVEYRNRYESQAKRFEKPDSYFDDPEIQKQLDIGVIVEMEHTNDKDVALNIAKDHLAEYPDYYTRLRKVIPDVPKSASTEKNVQVYNPDEVGFVSSKIPKQCGTCVKFSKPNICNLPLSVPVDPITDCCNNWKENENYEADIGSSNMSELTIVPFVQEVLKKRFSKVELANIVGHIQETKEADSDSCVSRKIKIISNEHPSWEHDKIIAVAYSYCDEKSASEKLEDTFMPKLAEDLMKYYKN